MGTEMTASAVYEYLKQVAPDGTVMAALPAASVRRYIGSLDENHLFHGNGVLISAMGFRYEGTFVHGQMDGPGCIVWSSGITYEGEFQGNAPTGKGVFTWANGDRYVGEVEHGLRHGSGELSTERGVYTGAWVHGKRHGKGRQTYTGDSYYEGEWVDNQRHGLGKLVYPNGDVYDGMWREGKRHGFGTMGWKYGKAWYVEVYEGEWSNGVPHGHGRSTYVHYVNPESAPHDANSPSIFVPPACSVLNVYEGNYVDGKRHGSGVFFYADGSTYEGEWCDGNKQGRGKCTTGVGASHYGTFQNNDAEELLKGEESSGALPSLALAGLIGISEGSLEEATSALRLLLLRYNTLKDLFNTYSRKNEGVGFITTPSNWWKHRAPGHMSVPQYLRLLSDAHIINGGVSIGDAVDCVVATIEKEDEADRAKLDDPWSERLQALRRDVLRLEGYINYRQFVECLVRLAAIVCVGPKTAELARRFATLVEGSLVVTQLAEEPLCPLTREMEEVLTPHLPVLQSLFLRLASRAHPQKCSTSAVLPVRNFIMCFRSLFHAHGVGPTEAVNRLFPFDRFKTPGTVPSVVCQPRNVLGFSVYEKSCGPHDEFAAALVASEGRLTFVEFVEAVVDTVRLTGAESKGAVQERLQEILATTADTFQM